MKTLLGESVIFTTIEGEKIYMKVQAETENAYLGYDRERINFGIPKSEIVEVYILRRRK